MSEETRFELGVVSERELAIILAALRHIQGLTKIVEAYPDHFDGDTRPVTDSEIDELCERLNTEAEEIE